jgi:hypothetical protein
MKNNTRASYKNGKKQIIKSFVGSRGGFSKEPLVVEDKEEKNGL